MFLKRIIRTYDHQEGAGIHSPNVLSPSIWKYNGENDWKYNSVCNNRKINKKKFINQIIPALKSFLMFNITFK